jgi:pantoate--beta-alanine ligase
MLPVFTNVKDLRQYLDNQENKTIGFVPTMGALHHGHVSLVQEAKQRNNQVVCSIFVNPTQFNDKSDLEKYPRTLEADIDLLQKAGCNALFLPTYDEIYPPNFDFDFMPNVGKLAEYYEGAHRPGHFKGMLQVVRRLLEAVKPQFLYMGQKDYQQQLLCKRMIDVLQLPVQLIRCPIIREPHGLAMSSRNERLTPTSRLLAAQIHNTLNTLKTNIIQHPQNWENALNNARKELDTTPFQLDYLDIACADTLSPWQPSTQPAVILVVTKLDGVRLLDNLLFQLNFTQNL